MEKITGENDKIKKQIDEFTKQYCGMSRKMENLKENWNERETTRQRRSKEDLRQI